MDAVVLGGRINRTQLTIHERFSQPAASPVRNNVEIFSISITKSAEGILHWKMMLFAGQNMLEFSGAKLLGRFFRSRIAER
jgi:hypothetical protein